MIKWYAIFFIQIFCAGLIHAQFSVKGSVKSTSDQEPLTGATVFIKNKPEVYSTDENGKFEITGINQERIVIVIQYLGYLETETAIDFKKSPEQKITIELAPNDYLLSEVVVEGIASGQIKAMIEMKQADNIKNIVNAAQILTFPDLNAAEVMQRIPGITLQRDQGEGRFVQLRGTPPELTNFNINGEQIPSPQGSYRYVGRDIIPSDQIKAVEVTKVLTPDMEGDGIGGSVNIKTKTAEEGQTQIKTTLSSGYNQLRQSPNYNLQFAFGHRIKGIGIQINASYFENNQ